VAVAPEKSTDEVRSQNVVEESFVLGHITRHGEDVDDPGGEAGGHAKGSEVCEFGGFEDDGVARCECWCDFPAEHQKREVPGHDLALTRCQRVRAGCMRVFFRPSRCIDR